MTKLDDLRALAERVTAGVYVVGEDVNDYGEVIRGPNGEYIARTGRNLSEKLSNAQFLAASANLARKLLSEEGERLMARAMFDMEWAKLGPTESEWVSSKPYWIDHARAAINALIEASDV